MKRPNIEVHWQTLNLEGVIRHYIDGLNPKKGTKILSTEFFVDIQKGKVVLQILTRKDLTKRKGKK